MPREELMDEKQYLPSQWSTRFNSANKVIDNHYKIIRKGSDKARLSVPHELTGKYGPNSSDAIHVFGTDLSEDSPVCVYVHGGYWQNGCAKDHAFPAIPLHQVGYKLVALNYELCPKVTVYDIVQRLVQAVEFLNTHFPKSRHFTFVGHSAGSHLILCALMHLTQTDSLSLERIQHIFLVSGIYDLRDLVRHSIINPNNILGLTDENAEQLSPLIAFDFDVWSEHSMEIHLVVAENDSLTFRKQSKCLYEKFKMSGVQADSSVLNGCDHFDIVEQLSDNSFKLTQMILKTA